MDFKPSNAKELQQCVAYAAAEGAQGGQLTRGGRGAKEGGEEGGGPLSRPEPREPRPQVVLYRRHRCGLNEGTTSCEDGLKGIGEALGAVFAATTLQTCIVHLIRNSLD